MDSSVLLKDQIWFLRVCHHVSNVLYYAARWLTGFWSTQVTVEGIVLNATMHRGRDSSVVKDPLGERSRSPLYVGLPFAWGL